MSNMMSVNASWNPVKDKSFGPFLDPPEFDFTLLFEDTTLSIGPSVLLLLLTPFRIYHLRNATRQLKGSSYLQSSKIAFLFIFAILQVVNLFNIARAPFHTVASLPAAVFALVAALDLCVLSYFEHTRNVRPSPIINVYLLLTVPFDAVELRTRWLRDDQNLTANGVASAVLAIKLLVLISEATEKRNLLYRQDTLSPEATSGVYSRSIFWWLNPLLRLGFRGVVTNDDLFDVDGELSSASAEARLAKHWLNRSKYPQKHTLVWVMFRAMLIPLASAVLPRIALIFFSFMQPFLIRSLTGLVADPDSPSADSRGWGLTAAFGLVFIGLAITAGSYQHQANRVACMVRGAFVSAIYAHTLDISITSLDESAAVTLMSADVEVVCNALLSIHAVWSCPIEVALAIWLLQKEIGFALLGPLLATAVAVAGPSLISAKMGAAQKLWMERIQTRIDATAKVLQNSKGVKMLGFSSVMSHIIRQLRLDEITSSLKMRRLLVGLIAFGNISDAFGPGAAFFIYVLRARSSNQSLDVASAFTTLSLISLLNAPIRTIVFALPKLIGAVSCVDRIETYLSLPTRRDNRLLLSDLRGPSTDQVRQLSPIANGTGNFDIELDDLATERRNISPICIIARNLSLSWSTEDNLVIGDVSLDISTGNVTMIVGPVGSGKSSLLYGFLGELPSYKGNIYVDQPHVSYVSQSPWIQNNTIRNNIIGFSTFDSAWYSQVIYACAFDTDIESLPNDDSTKVGSAGIALSGGQKLRLALARAVYSRHKVLILDDVFSGLDAISEERIFSRLIGTNGLLHRLGATVILVTHAAHRLSYADHVVVFSANGTISEQGTFEYLRSNKGYITTLTAAQSIESENITESDTPPKLPLVTKDEDGVRRDAVADLHRQTGDWASYLYYFRGAGLGYVITSAGLLVAYAALTYIPILWFRFWTSAIAVHGNSVNGFYLGILVLWEVGGILTLMMAVGILLTVMIPNSANYLHRKLLDAVENAPLSFFTTTDTGEIVNRFSQDLSIIDMELPIALLMVSSNVFMAIIQGILICISTSFFAAVVPFVMVAMYFVQKYYLRTSRQIRLMDLEAKAPLYSNFLETLGGLATIRAFGWSANMKDRNRNLLDTSQQPYYLLFCIQRWLSLVIDLLVAALAVILVGLIVGFRHRSDAGFVGVALVSIINFNITLTMVVQNWTATETSMGAISRIKTFVERTPAENRPQEVQPVPEQWPPEGSISFSNITAVYEMDQEPVLREINLSISNGQKVGICGASGAGKSSLVALLLHMLEIEEGTIMIDGVDLSTIPRNTLRERLTIIPQEPIFLKGTVRQNLDPFNLPQNQSAAETVLRRVGLWTVIDNAGGLDVPMDSESLLSQGQRQLFCLARAMMKPSKIVIIDEATASVDLQTDELMQQIISEHFVGCTIIAIAHRLQTIRYYDRIVVFDSGRIVEYGAPDQLLADEGGRFRALWDS